MKKAVIVLSGGLDSSTCLYIAKSQGYELFPISFEYGQRHIKEIQCAKDIAYQVTTNEVRVIQLPTPKSALTGDSEIATGRTLEEMSKEIPKTEVAFRNQLFLTLALQYAHSIKADSIFIGVTAIDYSGYPDCRPEFIEKMQELIEIQEKHITIEAPLLQLYKAEIIDWGMQLGVPYEMTWSCYVGGTKPCGQCDSCLLRAKGFKEVGLEDPALK